MVQGAAVIDDETLLWLLVGFCGIQNLMVWALIAMFKSQTRFMAKNADDNSKLFDDLMSLFDDLREKAEL